MNTVRSKDSTILTYDVYGIGKPLIYITGASCFRTFQPIVDDVKVFGSEFTVYNYDRRGRGDSGDTQPYSIEREVDDIEALIDTAGERAVFHLPHPQKETDKGAVFSMRRFLENAGVKI